MSIGLEPGEVCKVELGSKRITFRHLSVRESRAFTRDLDAYLARQGSSDDDAADAAIALVQPYTTAQLAEVLTTSEAVLVPLAYQKARQLSEAELGKSLWQHISGVAMSAETALEPVETNQTATPP